MRRVSPILLLFFCVVSWNPLLAAGDPNDCTGCKDPALFSRMPGFYIYNSKELDFDRFEFPVAAGKNEVVEGRYHYVDYYANEGIKVPSGLQIATNYTNAVKAVGGVRVYQYEDGGTLHTTLKIVKNGAEVWAWVTGASNGLYKLYIVEKQAMNQDVVANAESMADNIKDTGKVAVYGIYFDTDKSEIKPESAAAIDEIAKLLKLNPVIKLYVVGHTDNVGTFDHNLKLSQARAASVVSELVKRNAGAAGRLTAFGAGPTSPVASNIKEEGRAKNRRVDLVAQ